MTFCGYNETMAAGLQLLVEGMVAAMSERHAKGFSMEEVVRAELQDLELMNQVLAAGDLAPESLANGLIAINQFAQFIFGRSRAESHSEASFGQACRRNATSFIALVEQTERRHQTELLTRGSDPGDPRAIRAVAEWILADDAQNALMPAE